MTASTPSPVDRADSSAPHPVAQLRAQRGLTREQLAVRAGVCAGTLRNLEVRGVRPTRATVKVLCLALEAEPSEIFPGIWGVPGDP
jgi:transcriptional regulator with XRE-family HTH domain